MNIGDKVSDEVSDKGMKGVNHPLNTYSRARGESGFTLMEVLIAVAAFAIVLSAITSVFHGALRLRNASAEMFDREMALQHTLTLLRKDIANLVLPGGTLFGQLQSTPTSSSPSGSIGGTTGSGGSMALLAAASRPGQSSPEFYTSTGRLDETSPWADVQKVSYYLAPSTNVVGGRDLVRSVTRNLLPSLQDQGVETPVLNDVESIYFQFHDGSQWQDTWDSSSSTGARLPTAIRAQITLAVEERGKVLPAPIEVVVPVLVSGGTNSTATGTNSTTTGGGGAGGGGAGGGGGGGGAGGGGGGPGGGNR